MFVIVGVFPDPSLTALCVVIWVVAISIAFGFYIPVLRARVQAGARRSPAGHSADQHHATAGPVVGLAPVAAVSPPEPPEGFNVLIVDDNDTNRLVLELILDSIGVAHASVANGLQAVEAMATCPYQAVLMDLQMPVMDGYEATRRIRALENQRGGAQSSIIVVSANYEPADIAAGRASGADEHLAKPISAIALLGALEACAAAPRLAA